MDKGLIITIDGPTGVGKSTVAKTVAVHLGLMYLDTGAMYRTVALQVMRNSLDLGNASELQSLLDNTHIEFVKDSSNALKIRLNGEDITNQIRSPQISKISSDVATKSEVRKKLVDIQRSVGKTGNIVVEGRDMGTYVFPEANFKFYLDASLNERANRRRNQLMENGIEIGMDKLLKDIELRDKQDTERMDSPLHPATNAVIIDTTNLDTDEVVKRIITEVKGEQ